MFHNKTAIVTGASSGFGFEIAKQLAEQGAKVFALARREDRLKDLANLSDKIIPVVLDVTSVGTDADAALRDVIANNKIDILVNNAGLAWGRESVSEAPREKWETMIDVNVKALIAVTQAVLPNMLQNGGGDIVNMGSIAGLESYAGGFAYCATKSAVRSITESMRHDLLGKNIRVMGIHPGLAETEFSLVRFDGDDQKAKAVYQGMTPLTATDVADAVVWSLSCPRHMNIQSMVILPTEQASATNVWRAG